MLCWLCNLKLNFIPPPSTPVLTSWLLGKKLILGVFGISDDLIVIVIHNMYVPNQRVKNSTHLTLSKCINRIKIIYSTMTNILTLLRINKRSSYVNNTWNEEYLVTEKVYFLSWNLASTHKKIQFLSTVLLFSFIRISFLSFFLFDVIY